MIGKRVLWAILLMLPLIAAHAALPDPFTAHYDVQFSGLGGKLVSQFSHNDGGNYVFENRTSAKGIARLARPRDVVDRSVFAVSDDSELRPLVFESEDGTRRNKNGNVVEFDWEVGNASSAYEGESREFDLEPQPLDRQLMQLALMRDLAAGANETSYTVIDRHDLKTYDFTVLGRETIEVPAGKFQVLKVRKQRKGSSRATLMWCAPELQYLPVMMQQLKEDKVIATLSLTASQ
ncbi:MAG: DUF3108 domain-containing protein [Gammaproteobacteria bacterium]|nr:DUF3108 domain-containing protein [Gammaproteobacteria bacterium]NND58705.1 DUF3108 domain-containing protein [Gammaproteobacteria bacterium]